MPERFLRLTEVQHRVPYSRSTIYLKVSRGEFPPPIELGARAVAGSNQILTNGLNQKLPRGEL